MPWLSEAMKGATSCENLRGLANTNRSAGTPMGQPIPSNRNTPEQSGGLTRGTETSQYPEEKKTIVIPQVAASEKGIA
jgi:hypothetical protein